MPQVARVQYCALGDFISFERHDGNLVYRCVILKARLINVRRIVLRV